MSQDFYNHVAQTSPESMGLEVVRAEGVYLFTPDGKQITDLISGICVSNVGHGAPEVIGAIQEQASKYLHPMVYGEVVMAPQVRYARRLSELLGAGFEKVYFTNSGAEAIEGALKVAKKFTGRRKLISFEGAYHGSTHGALSIGGNPELKKGYGPLLPDTQQIRFNHLEDLEQIDRETAAVVMEVIPGAAGYVMPLPGFLAALRQRCDDTGALLIVDEIQTGFGRSGSLFAIQEFGLKPDMLVLAKALGGGMPLGAFICRDEIMKVIQRDPVLGFITTFGGHPVCCAAGLAAMEKMLSDNLLDTVAAKEALIREELQHELILGLRGKGLLLAALFADFETAEKVRVKALELGLLTIGFLSIKHGLRISPPLSITEEELRKACRLFVQACEEA